MGRQKLGFNAFLIKNGIGEEVLPEKSIETAFNHPKVLDSIKNRLPLIKNLNWVNV